MKKRYAQVGVGGRSIMFTNAILGEWKESSELVAICDNNAGRLALREKVIAELGGSVKTYPAEQFDRMIEECRPDVVIVTTKDCFHDTYIVRAMELGCDVITEKPMTTDAAKCQAILDTRKRTGLSCRVTFNYRYAPPRSQLKELLMSGVIGEVHSVDFQWLLNTRHGADYFRRWHRNKANSGGLMVHKATHHFDLVNWWLSTVPETVTARGKRQFYTPKTADRLGLQGRAERCLDCSVAGKCPYHLDMRGIDGIRTLYLENEQYDGYFRDRCVFSDKIDIEDNMHLIVSYRSGAIMSYSLHAFMPWEGFIIAFNGSKGRLEHVCQESVYINGDEQVPGELVPEGTHTRIFPHFRKPYEVELWTGKGGHGGGDPVLLNDLLSEDPPADKYLRAADHRAGAYSILTGVAANVSMAENNRVVHVHELVSGLEEPDYPPMPSPDEPIDTSQQLANIAWEKAQKTD